jgi:undecaprenyl-diphosphatase
LNGLGSETFDGLWLFITKQSNWIPLFYSLYVIYTKLGVKQTLYLLLFIAVLVTITDQTTNLFKNGFQRLRPCNNLEINSFIRIVKISLSFSFSLVMPLIQWQLPHLCISTSRIKSNFLDFCSFGRSSLRTAGSWIALSVDILTYLFGFTFGFLMFKVYKIAQKKYFPL